MIGKYTRPTYCVRMLGKVTAGYSQQIIKSPYKLLPQFRGGGGSKYYEYGVFNPDANLQINVETLLAGGSRREEERWPLTVSVKENRERKENA